MYVGCLACHAYCYMGFNLNSIMIHAYGMVVSVQQIAMLLQMLLLLQYVSVNRLVMEQIA